MIIFVNGRNEIKDVNITKDKTLTPYEIAESDINPFANWSVAKICCYRVGLTPETETEVVGTEEITYTDLEGNEVTETREITETKETGKYFVSMMTPYVNSLIIEHLDRLGVYEEETKGIVNVVIGTDTEEMKAAEQSRKALQMYAQTLSDEDAMEISTIYPKYEVGKAYKEKEMLTYGLNSVGDPQLYRVVQAHTSQEDWKPDTTPTLYTPIGLDEEGYPIWARPTGAHDAYNTGDIVDYNGTLYKSLMDGNIYAPDEYPAGWEVYEERK